MPTPAPCDELDVWFAERLRPQLMAAVGRGDATGVQAALLESQLRELIDGAAPCRERREVRRR